MKAPVNAWTVRSHDPHGVLQHEQTFYVTGPASQPDAKERAVAHKSRIAGLYPDYTTTLTPSHEPTEEISQ